MSGGSVPIQGGVVLVLLRMNRIIRIDVNNFQAVVEPGVITRDLQQAVEAKGLFYPPDPSSSHFSTLGGNLAECAGGGRAVKYGVTRDYGLGLEVVLPTGEILKTGVRTAKGVVGYDLTRLMVGSKGTLGIITQMVLKLIPLPEARQTILAFLTKWPWPPEPLWKFSGPGSFPPLSNLWIIPGLLAWRSIYTWVYLPRLRPCC